MNTQSFVLYESVYKQFEIITKRVGVAEAHQFLTDIMNFGLYGILPDENSSSWLYGFEQSITSIANAKDRYETAVQNGKKGGRPKKELNETDVLQKKQELGTWKAVARYFGVSEQTLKNYRLEWETNPKNPKNLNDNDNVNDNVNVNEGPALAKARLGSGLRPDTPHQESVEIIIESIGDKEISKDTSIAGKPTLFRF